MDQARAVVGASDGRWAVVVEEGGRLLGWVEPGRAGDDLHGTDGNQVADHTRRLEAWIPLDASLKTAFAEMLQHDAAWVAVLDNDRYVGILTPDALHAALRRSVGGNSVPV
jgi:osmoprotectant transport system ATP-binding protein